METPGQGRPWSWWAGVPCSRVCGAVVSPLSQHSPLLQLLPPAPHRPDLAAGAKQRTTSSLFREELEPQPPSVGQKSVFLSSRPLHSCGESCACNGASASSPSFWAGPGSIAPPAPCCHPMRSRAGLPGRPGWLLSLLERQRESPCPGAFVLAASVPRVQPGAARGRQA